jgi:uncharacterized protein
MSADPALEDTPLRFLADEMLGRLARYLRFVGFDTAYARDLPDDEILRRSEGEGRILLTRDRRLASRSPTAVLLTSGDIADQFQRVRVSFPRASFEVKFDRCTKCNGRLSLLEVDRTTVLPAALPVALRESGVQPYRCDACGHLYWEGSHTRAIRERLASWGP